jgi:nicotinamide mononucleotide adenylyltransferase
MMEFKTYLEEHILDHLAGGGHGHYGHVPDNAFHGAHAAVAGHHLFSRMVKRTHGKSSGIIPQKKTDGSVSVVTVKNHPSSPHYNPNHPVGAVGVAYKGRIEAKTVPNHEKVSYSKEDVAKHYGKDHHLTPVLSRLVDHAHNIHGKAAIIQHDVHTTDPKNDLHHEEGRTHWQPNTIRNHTTDPHEIKKLKKAKVVIASHTGFDKNMSKARGLTKSDVKDHPDVYNVNLTAKKVDHSEVKPHLDRIKHHLRDKSTRAHLDVVGHASYNSMLERFTNHKVNKGEYGGEGHEPLKHEEFKHFVKNAHDKEIEKAKSEKGKASKTAERDRQLAEIDSHKHSIHKAFEVHHAMTNGVRHFVKKTHEADDSPIKHELPDGKGGYSPAPFEGVVPRGKHHKVNSQKFNDRAEFNRMNKINGEQRFGKKEVSESVRYVRCGRCDGKGTIYGASPQNDMPHKLQHYNCPRCSGKGKVKPEPKKEVKEETEGKHGYMTTGRFQPLHRGHEGLVNDTIARAKAAGTTAHVYVTHNKEGDERNPLSTDHRIALLNHAYRDHVKAGHVKFHAGSGMHANVEHFHKNNPHIKHAHVVLGDDRMDAAESIKKYNGKADKAGKVPYNFHSINVHQREKAPSKHDGIHATELRNVANSDKSDTEKHKFFKDRMHPNIPDHMINKTVKQIRDVSQAKTNKPKRKKTIKEMMEEINQCLKEHNEHK